MRYIKSLHEADSRDPRKKGEHKGSSSHSDLYTDEDPKGTIHGLGFKDAETANKGIDIIKKVDRTHAHKVQATLVMQQRAKVAIERTKDPEKKKNLKAAYEIWTKFLEEMKKKTQELKESENKFIIEMSVFERYSKLDSISNKLLGDCFRQWVLDFERGKKSSSYSFNVENPGLTFDLDCSIYFKGKGFEVLNSTGADGRDEDDEGDWQDPFVNIDFACNPEWLPTYWSEIYFILADTLRHEIEHITQDGIDIGNYRKGKPNEPDDIMRMMINNGMLPKYHYLLLPKEVDANLQGLRFEAKKRKEKIIYTVNRYLDQKEEMGEVTQEEREIVLNKWRARAKHLGFKI